MPAYNEAEILESSVRTVVEGMRGRGSSFEVLVVENGSTDATLTIAKELASELPEVRVEHRDDADYGRALQAGLLAASGDAVVNFDADYFDLDFLDAATAQVLAPDGPAIVVGSKRAAGATDERDVIRRFATTVFSTILRLVFGLRVSDTHGVKAMRRASVEPYARECKFGQDLFDTELILRVERDGLRTAEIPVEVRELRPARSSFLSRVPRTLRARSLRGRRTDARARLGDDLRRPDRRDRHGRPSCRRGRSR
jgi:glycosyltransferase involved in cell wall biosynthesis